MKSDVMDRVGTREPVKRAGAAGGASVRPEASGVRSTARPASPARPPDPSRSGRPARSTAPEPQPAKLTSPAPAPAGQIRRTSFIVLLLGLLGGGLVCLLVVNTTLAANSIEITDLQKQNAVSTQHVQELQQQIAVERSDASIEKAAWRLGMRPDPALIFIDLRTKSLRAPSAAAVAADQAAARSAAEKAAHGAKARRAQPAPGGGTGQ